MCHRVQCVLGVADDKLITLRLQVPEDLYSGSGLGLGLEGLKSAQKAAVVAQIDAIINSFTVGNIL